MAEIGDERTAGADGPGEMREAGACVVPLLEACPACGASLAGAKCKVYCPNESCTLYRRIIENCAGD